MKKIVVFTGAGVSAESGIATFRASDGLWENHRIEDVASPEGWAKDPSLVLEFYNMRRAQARKALPNLAHETIRELEQWFEVVVVTQNIDNLHERAGSSRIIHLHGSIFHARGTGKNEDLVELHSEDIQIGDLASDGSQLRPHIVWFGESVPMMDFAIEEVLSADVLLVVGTSLQVYPAASLLSYLPSGKPIFLVDPSPSIPSIGKNLEVIKSKAVEGLPLVKEMLLRHFSITTS